MIINREMLIVLLRAQRQRQQNMDIAEFQWLLHEITDAEFIELSTGTTKYFMDRLAPFMDAEPKR